MTDPQVLWDGLRLVIVVLFGLALGETAWIMRAYFGVIKRTRRLLPMHVFMISAGTLGLEAVAAYQSTSRLGDPATLYIPVNLVLFAMVYAALLSMRVHITRKKNTHNHITSMLNDPKMMP